MIDAMLTDTPESLSLTTLKVDSGRRTLNSLEAEVEKLRNSNALRYPMTFSRLYPAGIYDV